MFNLSRSSPRVSPAIKQVIAHGHAYPFPVTPGGGGTVISRMNSPLPSPLIPQPNLSMLRTPISGPCFGPTGYPFPTTREHPEKRIHFQLIPVSQ